MNKLRTDISVIELVDHVQNYPAGEVATIDQMAAVIAGECEAEGNEDFPDSFYEPAPLECFGRFSHPSTGDRRAEIYGCRTAIHSTWNVCRWDPRRWATFEPGFPDDFDGCGWPKC